MAPSGEIASVEFPMTCVASETSAPNSVVRRNAEADGAFRHGDQITTVTATTMAIRETAAQVRWMRCTDGVCTTALESVNDSISGGAPSAALISMRAFPIAD